MAAGLAKEELVPGGDHLPTVTRRGGSARN